MIEARWVLPIVPKNTLLEHQAVIVHIGVIVDICTIEHAHAYYEAAEIIKVAEHVLMPGLINLHTHAAMNLMRGLADDLPLMPWLESHIWPAEAQFLSANFVKEGTLLACAEMLSGGITTFNDMYFYPEAAAQACLQIGLRANLGLVVLEFSTKYASNATSYIEKGTQTRDALKNEPLLSFSFAPHAPYTVSDETFLEINILAEQLEMGIHTHLHETLEEISQSKQTHGLTPIARFAKLGLLGANTTLAHCVHLEPIEMQMLADNGCHIAHCPSSNLKLGSGIAPIDEYLKRGINVGLGTDGAASNNRLDMFTEIRLAALLAKGVSRDATAISAHLALEMATINGARALKLEDKIGSIEIGKLADLIAIDLSGFNVQPCYDPISHLVYVAGREQLSHCWVNGDLKYNKPKHSEGVFSDIEPQELEEIIANWQTKLTELKSQNDS